MLKAISVPDFAGKRKLAAFLLACVFSAGNLAEAQNFQRPLKRRQAATFAQGLAAKRFAQSGYQLRNAPQGSAGAALVNAPVTDSAAGAANSAQKNDSLEKSDNKDKKKEKEDSGEQKKKKVRGDAPCVSWVKFGVPVRANLLCVHGLALNSASFEKFGKDMSQIGIATYAIDVRGFGSWMEAKGHTKVDFKDCIQDVRKTLEWLHKSDPSKPVFLLGESMGGAIALHAAAEFPELMNGVVSVCSASERFKQKKTELKVFLHALTGPTREFDIGKQLVDQAAGDNAALKEKWENDELSRMELSPLELMHFQHFMNENHEMAEKITQVPVLMVQGRKDELVKPEGTEELYNELKTADKQLLWVENGEHLIFENSQYLPSTLNAVSNWIFNHCPQASAPAKTLAGAISSARDALAKGKLDDALLNSTNALQMAPNNAEAHLLMGKTQLQMKKHMQARQHLVQAVRLGRGSAVASEANKTLMMLPQSILAPKKQLAKSNQLAKPSVMVFNASWCKPCQDMNEIVEQAKSRAGNKVDFSIIDVDEEKNAELVERYSIGPVPTTVFLAADGSVAGFQVGYDGVDGMLKGLQKIIQVGGPQQLGVPPLGKNARPLRGRKRLSEAASFSGASAGF